MSLDWKWKKKRQKNKKDSRNVMIVIKKSRLNKIAARWPAKAVAQFYFY